MLVSTGDHDAIGSKKEFGHLIDADISYQINAFLLAVFGYTKKADIEKASWDWGVGFDLGTRPVSGLGYGLRVEYDSDGNNSANTSKISPIDSEDDRTLQGTVGPQWRFNDALIAKLDYTFAHTSYDGVNLKKEAAHSVNLAAVYKF